MVAERDIEKCHFSYVQMDDRPVTLTLTLDRNKVVAACTIHTELPDYPTM